MTGVVPVGIRRQVSENSITCKTIEARRKGPEWNFVIVAELSEKRFEVSPSAEDRPQKGIRFCFDGSIEGCHSMNERSILIDMRKQYLCFRRHEHDQEPDLS